MAIRLYSKHTLFSLALIICILVAYMRQFPETENNDKQSYFENMQKGAATTPFDLPVHIITGQKINPSQASTENTTQTTIGISSNATCASDEELCNKIKFIGSFSDADKRKYQSLIIRQIKSIDTLLDEKLQLKDVLYSITLDKSQGTRRGRAGRETIIIYLGNIKSQDEFLEILTHELGHIIDLGILQGYKRIMQQNFYDIDHTFFAANDSSIQFYSISRLNNTTRKQRASAMGFVGRYAMNDPFEDFAESMNMYLNHYNVFAVLANSNSELKKKFTFMQELFHKKYLKADIATASVMKDNLETRPRDTTKGY